MIILNFIYTGNGWFEVTSHDRKLRTDDCDLINDAFCIGEPYLYASREDAKHELINRMYDSNLSVNYKKPVKKKKD